MRQTILAAILIALLTFFLPALSAQDGGAETPGATSTAEPAPTVSTATDAAAAIRDSDTVLRVLEGDTVRQTTLGEHLLGVVRGEMPATFHIEALKAQAVAERTCLYYQLSGTRKEAHPDADVCTDSACCSAWLSEEAAREKWGDRFDECEAKVRQAVEETDGQVVLYEGEPIMAVFHASSAGCTVDSGDVWAASLPYLRSVESPEGSDSVPNYYSVSTFTADDFKKLFLAAHSEAKFGAKPAEWIRDIQRSAADRVESAVVGGVSVTGRELRSIFALRSACFTVECGADVTFRVTGYGHGVGMSQYGANVLAREGRTYEEILTWYYTDTTVGDYTK